ncbi:MAG: hypothetical protein KF912_12490 [Phycisphaeraceae bacterium]|nr:hypothetical protein [Phycisphaeraceae bacterium]MBX3368122.1 hypothetical protein [Phycisphaeraceae bacterium]QYK47792.1 MAG: hypothetical protein KF838_13500 [Phycisphaeraceae bacterium]
MASIPHHPSARACPAEAGLSARVRVAWTIAPEAMRAARPDLAAIADARSVMLVWSISGVGEQTGEATVMLEADGRDIGFALAPAGLVADVRRDEASGTIGVRIAGLLDLVLDASSLEPLYARTSLLGVLGLRGGSYRVARASRE